MRSILIAASAGVTVGIFIGALLFLNRPQVYGYPYCASATGSDSYACNFTPPFTRYDEDGVCTVSEVCTGTVVQVLADVANTGMASFSPNGLAAKEIGKGYLVGLQLNDIAAGQILVLAYNRNSDSWQMVREVPEPRSWTEVK